MLNTKEAIGSFEETLDRLAQVVTGQYFSVIETIDLKAKLNAKDIEFERACTVFEVCNPHRAKLVLDENMARMTALPCRISVYIQSGQVFVAMAGWPDGTISGSFGNEYQSLINPEGASECSVGAPGVIAAWRETHSMCACC